MTRGTEIELDSIVTLAAEAIDAALPGNMRLLALLVSEDDTNCSFIFPGGTHPDLARDLLRMLRAGLPA